VERCKWQWIQQYHSHSSLWGTIIFDLDSFLWHISKSEILRILLYRRIANVLFDQSIDRVIKPSKLTIFIWIPPVHLGSKHYRVIDPLPNDNIVLWCVFDQQPVVGELFDSCCSVITTTAILNSANYIWTMVIAWTAHSDDVVLYDDKLFWIEQHSSTRWTLSTLWVVAARRYAICHRSSQVMT